jgi:hypothetical protein
MCAAVRLSQGPRLSGLFKRFSSYNVPKIEKKSVFEPLDTFPRRHLGPHKAEIEQMLKTCKVQSLDEVIQKAVPSTILVKKPIEVGDGISEKELIARLRAIASKNRIFKSYIGMGYYDCIVPAVIQRNILENPQWYTQVYLFLLLSLNGILCYAYIYVWLELKIIGQSLYYLSIVVYRYYVLTLNHDICIYYWLEFILYSYQIIAEQ